MDELGKRVIDIEVFRLPGDKVPVYYVEKVNPRGLRLLAKLIAGPNLL